MARLEFYFDCSSPWTYMAIAQIGALAARTGADLEWKPVLVGGIFNQVNQQVYDRRAAPDAPKYQYYLKDLDDWARHHGMKIIQPSIFPVNAVKAQRACVAAADAGRVEAFAIAVCAAYWGDDRDISQDDVLADCAVQAGLDGPGILAKTGEQAIKDRLRVYTQEVIDRGGFGSPTMFVNGDDMYFGQDRLQLVEAALTRPV